MSTHFLHEFLKPKSVAIYGANNTYGTTMGTMLMMNLIMTGYKEKIFPIHLKLENVLGYTAYKSIADVPEIPDLVIIVLPTKIVPQILRDCGEKGVKKVVIISGGFREVTGDRENTLTEEITEIAEKYGIRFIGPNCLGFYNAWMYENYEKGAFNMMIFERQPMRGKFSIASQSGTMTSHLFLDPDSLDVKLGKSISIGNEANIDMVDFLDYFRNDEETDVIGLYIEEVKRGQEFLKIAKEITPKKPIVAIYSGGSGAGNRAISSHTGSMAGDSRVFDAMVKGTGIIKTDYVEEFLDMAGILLKGIYPKGKRIGIITNSGGPGAIIANNAEKIGLEIPEFSSELKEKLSKLLPHTASWKNPIDCTFDMNLNNFYVVFPKLLMKSGEVDLIIMYGTIGFHQFLPQLQKEERLAPYLEIRHDLTKFADQLHKIFLEPTIKASKRASIPIFYINPQNISSVWTQRMRELGGAVFQFWDKPVRCAFKLCEYAEYRRNHS